MSKNSCELCKNQAAIFCESDEARLCWVCDENIHSANFLVARHSRTLLCHVCCSPTSWKASGLKLGHTFSVCQACSAAPIVNKQDFQENSSLESETDDNGKYYSETDSDYCSEEGEENVENQVVPWEGSLKKMRDLDDGNDGCCSNCQVQYDGNDGSSSTGSLRQSKMWRTNGDHGSSAWDLRSRSEAVVDKLHRLQ